MKPRRIIYAWNYREWGGAQIYFLSLVRALQQGPTAGDPVDVSVVVPEGRDARILDLLAELGVQIESVGEPPPFFGPERGLIRKLTHRTKVFWSENRLITKILKAVEDADEQPGSETTIVHIDLGFWQSYRALTRLCRRAHVVVTQHTALADPHGLRSAIWRSKGRRLSRLPNFVVLASNNDAKRSLLPFLSAEKFDSICVTYTGIDPEEIRAVQADRIRSDQTRVMTVGQFNERKGCWTVLDALQRLRDAGERVRFVWLGASPLDAATHSRIESYGLGDSFRFLSAEEIGPRQQLLSTLATADIFVLASTNEGLPIALAEAMALGLPCIASRVGAIPEAIDHDVSGLLIEPGDADALANALRTLIHDEESRTMFGTAARAIAFEKFDQKKTAEETVEIYNKLWKTHV